MRDSPNGRSPGWGSGSFFCAGFLQAVFFRRRSDGARELFSRAPAEISVRARREFGKRRGGRAGHRDSAGHFAADLLSACRRADVECRLSPSRHGSFALLSCRTSRVYASANAAWAPARWMRRRAPGVQGTQVTRASSSLTMTSLSGATKKPWLLAGRLSSVTPSAVLTVQPAAVLTA